VLLLQAVILGIVQGLTEFIPISSSAHLVIIPWLFGWKDPALESLSFDVALHMGTLLALIVFFAKDWVRLIKGGVQSIVERKIGQDPDRRLAWMVVIGCIPGGIAGFLFESKIDKLFHNDPINPSAMISMAVIIAVMGGLLFAAEKFIPHTRKTGEIKFMDAVWIGLSQALAIFPGVSRSGSTITAGLAIGLERETAARFSFLLSAPIIAGAGLNSLLKFYKGVHSGAIAHSEIILFPVGILAAAVSGFFCIRFLLQFLQKNKINIFVYYRWALAAVVIAFAILRG
jgi:undecaprenyl-diphosphatase